MKNKIRDIAEWFVVIDYFFNSFGDESIFSEIIELREKLKRSELENDSLKERLNSTGETVNE